MEAKRSLRALRVVAWLGSQQRDISKAIESKVANTKVTFTIQGYVHVTTPSNTLFFSIVHPSNFLIAQLFNLYFSHSNKHAFSFSFS